MRSHIGRALQIVGLLLTGAVCVVAFGGDMSERAMFAYGFGGFGVFWIGTLIRGRG